MFPGERSSFFMMDGNWLLSFGVQLELGKLL